MRKRLARVLVAVLAFVLLAVGHSGCGGKSYSSPSAPSATPVPTPRY